MNDAKCAARVYSVYADDDTVTVRFKFPDPEAQRRFNLLLKKAFAKDYSVEVGLIKKPAQGTLEEENR